MTGVWSPRGDPQQEVDPKGRVVLVTNTVLELYSCYNEEQNFINIKQEKCIILKLWRLDIQVGLTRLNSRCK